MYIITQGQTFLYHADWRPKKSKLAVYYLYILCCCFTRFRRKTLGTCITTFIRNVYNNTEANVSVPCRLKTKKKSKLAVYYLYILCCGFTRFRRKTLGTCITTFIKNVSNNTEANVSVPCRLKTKKITIGRLLPLYFMLWFYSIQTENPWYMYNYIY